MNISKYRKENFIVKVHFMIMFHVGLRLFYGPENTSKCQHHVHQIMYERCGS